MSKAPKKILALILDEKDVTPSFREMVRVLAKELEGKRVNLIRLDYEVGKIGFIFSVSFEE